SAEECSLLRGRWSRAAPGCERLCPGLRRPTPEMSPSPYASPHDHGCSGRKGRQNLLPSDCVLDLFHCQAPATECQFSICGPTFRKMPKPGDLPFGEIPTARLNKLDSLLQIRFAVEMGEQLLVTQGLSGLPAERPRQPPQSGGFVQPTLVDHAPDSI